MTDQLPRPLVTPALDPVAASPGDRVGLGGFSVPSSQPYPWPYDGSVMALRTAVVVVAPQVGLAPRCPDAAAALAVIADLTAAATAWGARIIVTRHAASPALRRPGILATRGSDEWELIEREPATVIDAYGQDGFSGSPLAEHLAGAGIDHLLVCGLGLEGPVHSTLRSANDRGLECLLVIDGCASLDPTVADASVRMIEMSGGIFGAVAPSVDVLAGLESGTIPFSQLGG